MGQDDKCQKNKALKTGPFAEQLKRLIVNFKYSFKLFGSSFGEVCINFMILSTLILW